MSRDDYLASEAEREHAIVSLRNAVAASRMTLEEFGERVGVALQARTRGDLDALTGDLPAAPATLHPNRRRTRVTAALLAHVVRRGQLRLGRRTAVVSVLSDVDFDLRDSVVEVGEVTVTVMSVLGNVDVYVPEGIDVQVSGFSLMGHRRDWGRDVSTKDAPAIHVRVFGLASTIDVWRVPSGLAADLSAVIRHVREATRQAEIAHGT